MTPKEERVWRYLVLNRKASVAETADACDVDTAFVENLIARIGSPDWRQELASAAEPPRRVKILSKATELTGGDRNAAYGPPYKNLSDCAAVMSAYLSVKNEMPVAVSAEDVAWLMTIVKMTRAIYGGFHEDNYVDASAYASIAGECRAIEAGVDRLEV